MASVRLLIVDDSAVARRMLAAMVADDPGIELVGMAADPVVARAMIRTLNPDVVTLDVEMPGMDGLSFLARIMALRPMPVIIVSGRCETDPECARRAMALGAAGVVAKPSHWEAGRLAALQAELVGKIKAAARAIVAPEKFRNRVGAVIAIGASTGGVEALGALLPAFPADAPPVLVTQHMPGGFTALLARRLDRLCAMGVAEAREGEALRAGEIRVAPGDRHLLVRRQGGGLVCHLSDAPPMSGHRPSVDVMFGALAAVAPACAVGALLTGMGRDGAEGLGALREAGALTIGQDEASAVVYGMPRVARACGAVMRELPLERIAAEILAHVREPADA